MSVKNGGKNGSTLMEGIQVFSRRMDEKMDFLQAYARLEVICRVLIVLTNLEDSIRIFLTLEGQMNTMLHFHSKLWGSVFLFLSMFLQFGGSIMVITKVWPQTGVVFLLFWNFIHPIVYEQLENVEFVLELVTISGGLLILLAHLKQIEGRDYTPLPLGGPAATRSQEVGTVDILQAVGRMCLMTVIFFHGVQIINDNQVEAHKDDHSIFAYVLDYVLVATLFGLTSLVVIGLKARWVAFSVAVSWLMFCIYAHPFWIARYAQYFGAGVRSDTLWRVELEQFYFFQSVSTVGALLLLALYGPGNIAAEKTDKMAMKAFTHKGGD